MQTRTILIGVRDDGRILGINLSATTFEEWAQKMHSIHVDAIRKHPGVPLSTNLDTRLLAGSSRRAPRTFCAVRLVLHPAALDDKKQSVIQCVIRR